MILHTDLAKHFDQVKSINTALAVMTPETWSEYASDPNKPIPAPFDKKSLLALVLHAADISNAAKPWHLQQLFTMQILQEFFDQGDELKQRNMPLPPLSNRTTTNIPDSQIGFIAYLVKPLYESMSSKKMHLYTFIHVKIACVRWHQLLQLAQKRDQATFKEYQQPTLFSKR